MDSEDITRETSSPFNYVLLFVIPAVVISLYMVLKLIVSGLPNLRTGGIHYVPQEIVENKVEETYNSFTFQVIPENSDDVGLECKVHCTSPFYLFGVYGVPIHELSTFLNLNWTDFKSVALKSTREGSFASVCKSRSNQGVLKFNAGEYRVKFSPSADCPISDLHNQDIPKMDYSFVAVMFLQNDLDIKSNQVTSFATAVHLPLSRTSFPPQIILQYAKLSSGYVSILKKIYVSAVESERMRCVICFGSVISVILVPCGHASICYDCLKHIEHAELLAGHSHSCPVCRRPIHAFFRCDL